MGTAINPAAIDPDRTVILYSQRGLIPNCTVPFLPPLLHKNPTGWFVNVIQMLKTQSIKKLIPMSLSAESLNLRRKHVATEHVINNRDPLVARKKARQAVQSNATITTAAPAPKKSASVSLHLVLRHVSDHCPNRQQTFIIVLLSTWKMIMTVA